MLGSIRGKLLEFEGLSALVECADGRGYEIEVPANLLAELKVGEPCFLYVHHVVREDAELLYGFSSKEARLLFREVLKVNGIGPRIAMALLSTFDLYSFVEVINQGRVNSLVAVPGVGKKTAERLVVEMKDRLDKLRLGAKLSANSSISAAAATAEANSSLLSSIEHGVSDKDDSDGAISKQQAAFNCDDAIAALVSLGYKENIAMSTVKTVYESGMTTEQIIVKALAQLSKHK